MKKFLTLTLAILLIIPLLTSCSNNEIAILKIANDITSMETGRLEGQIEVTQPQDCTINFVISFDFTKENSPYVYSDLNILATVQGNRKKVEKLW